MFCPNCGAKAGDDANFCMKCGKPLAGEEAEADQREEGLLKEQDTENNTLVSAPKIEGNMPGIKEPLKPAQKGGRFKDWLINNQLVAVLILIAALFVIFVITFIGVTVASSHHEYDRSSNGYRQDYYGVDDAWSDGESGNDQWYNNEEWQHEYSDVIHAIEATVPQGYRDTYGRVLSNYFYYGDWTFDSFYADEDFYDYAGLCIYNDAIVDAVISFDTDENGEYRVYSVSIDNKILSVEDTEAFVAQMFDWYQAQEKHDGKTTGEKV